LQDVFSCTAIADITGTIQERYGYNAFGLSRVMDANFNVLPSTNYDWETRYACYRFDAESNFYQVRNRYLHPTLGRWLTRDPIGYKDGMNLYRYVSNKSTNLTDALGLAFYAVDGTWTKPSDQANPWWLCNETTETPAYYHRGPHLGITGLDSYIILLEVKNHICTDFCAANQNCDTFSINMTGWSRGAIIVMGIAKKLNDDGCTCSGKKHKPVNVNWIGLFDAVAQIPGPHWWPKTVPSNVSNFDHAIKTAHQLLFPTYHFTGGTEQAFNRYDGTPTLHVDIGESKKLGNNNSYNWIKSKAIAAGVAF